MQKRAMQVENWSGILPHTVTQDFYASLLRSNCAAVLALAARPEDAAVSTDAGLNAAGWRVRLNRTLASMPRAGVRGSIARRP
jgi:hypothetical protein